MTYDHQLVLLVVVPEVLAPQDRQSAGYCLSLVMLLLLAKPMARAQRKLVSTSWGYDRQSLCANYIATGRSKVEYVASSWLPWISNSTLENRERSQRNAEQAITGQLLTTPVEAILAEANQPSIRTQAIQQTTIAMDKSLGTTQINPRHTTENRRVQRRTKKPSWREKAGVVLRKVIGDTKLTTTPPLKRQWNDTGTHIFQIVGQKTVDAASDHEIFMQTLEKDWDSYNATIYNNGAATRKRKRR